MTRSPRGRKPARPAVRIASPLVRTLMDAAAGKEGAIGESAGLGSGYISQLRYGNITDPGIGRLEKLAAVLGYRIVLMPASSVSSSDTGRTADDQAE